MDQKSMNHNSDNVAKKITRTADRALDVLLCFSLETPALTMTQISEKVGLNKSTIHRLLATLEEKRFVRRDPDTGIYRLGFRLLQMANLALEDMNIRHFSLQYMKNLGEEFRETVDLAVLDDDEVIFIDTVESPQRVKLAASPGQHLPAYNTASGKAILAFLPEEDVVRIFNSNNPVETPQKDQALHLFLDDLKASKQRGYALDCESLEVGINAVSSPIFGINRKPIASLAIAGPAYRLDEKLLHVMGQKLVRTTDEISKKLLLY